MQKIWPRHKNWKNKNAEAEAVLSLRPHPTLSLGSSAIWLRWTAHWTGGGQKGRGRLPSSPSQRQNNYAKFEKLFYTTINQWGCREQAKSHTNLHMGDKRMMATVGVTGEGFGANMLGDEGSDRLALRHGSGTITAPLWLPMEPLWSLSPPSVVMQQPTSVGWRQEASLLLGEWRKCKLLVKNRINKIKHLFVLIASKKTVENKIKHLFDPQRLHCAF